MCSALILVHGLKNQLYSCACSALVSVRGLKNELYLCVARLFWSMDYQTRYIHV